jgi:hypothetical protein
VWVIVGESGEEGAVESGLVDVEVAERGERREAGPEVVDRNLAAEPVERVDDFGAALIVGDHTGLGRLERDRVCGKGVAANVAATICGVSVGPVALLAANTALAGTTNTVCTTSSDPVTLSQR